MTEDVFQQRAQRDFVEFCEDFVNFLKRTFPDCEASKDLHTLFFGVIKSSPSKEKEMIESWAANAETPLKHVKYGRSIERLTRGKALCFHACSYKDADGVMQSTESQLFHDLDIAQKIKDPALKAEDVAMVWKYINKLNQCSIDATNRKMPQVPTREQIQENIKQNRRQADDNEHMSIQKAFQATMTSLVSKHDASPPAMSDEEQLGECMRDWADMGRRTVDGVEVVTLMQKRDRRVAALLQERYGIGNTLDEQDWELLDKLNGYSSVGTAVPARMMHRIEDVAGQIASDLANGRATLNDVNLTDLSNQVLSQCSQEEMNSFAKQIDTLLPAITTLTKETKDMSA